MDASRAGRKRGKYATLIDEETWAFIDRTDAWYPPDAVDYSIEQQRDIYDRMCREFFAGYPEGVTAEDGTVASSGHSIPVRHYSAANAKPAARIVYIHGGGFVVGGLESHDDVCAELCARTGYLVMSVDYRLAPEHTFPADFEDAMAGFAHATELDELPIVLVGDSAGGNLAAAVSHATRRHAVKPVGQVLIYPGLGSDLTHGTFIEHAEAPLLTTKDTTFYKTIRTGGDENVLRDPRCTPLSDTDFSGLPPTVVISAECDPLSGDGEAYCTVIKNAGGRAHWINEKGLVHGYLRARHSVTRARESFARIVEAAEVLGRCEWLY